MAQATMKNTEPNPEEKLDNTPLRAMDDLNMSLGKARGIVSVIREGAGNADTDFNNVALVYALSAVCGLLNEVRDSAEGLHTFAQRV